MFAAKETPMNEDITVALAGNPNSGKTTLFNTLTGSRQHVGNYPGVTVEKKEGVYNLAGRKIQIVDLPGTYSLTAYSVEEVVARDFLVGERPNLVVNTVDASNLERNLYLTCQFLEMGIPTVIALNMIDLAKSRGVRINAERLSSLLGVPVVPIIARSGQGTAELMETAVRVADQILPWEPIRISYGEDLDSIILEMESMITQASFLTAIYPARWTAIKYLENDQQVVARGRTADPLLSGRLEEMTKIVADHLLKTLETYPEAIIADHRYGAIQSILKQGVQSFRYNMDRLHTSDRIDRVLTNRFLGPLCMLVILFGLYHFTFAYSKYPVAWLEIAFGWLGSRVDVLLPDGHLKSLILSGIIHGMGGVLGFVPLIMFMFFGIAILEDSGYLARVAFMMDRIFRTFGLHGSSVMAFIISGGIAGGCAVPGVMATRTLRSYKERMATLLTVPFMNCGAKLPVMMLLIGTFFAHDQARYLFIFTLLSWAVALLVAKFLRLTVLRGEATPFVMELPPYRFPTLRGLLIHTWERTWQYIRKAGTVILGFSILFWAMMTFPCLPVEKVHEFELRRQEIESLYTAGSAELAGALAERKGIEAGAALRYSLAGRLGTAMESISWLAGFDWRTNIALLGGVAAKEIIISTLGTAYSLSSGDADESSSLSAVLAADSAWSPLLALALIIFIMFYSPCFATLICIVKESGSWKWALFSVFFNTGVAFLLAVLVYRLGGLCRLLV